MTACTNSTPPSASQAPAFSAPAVSASALPASSAPETSAPEPESANIADDSEPAAVQPTGTLSDDLHSQQVEINGFVYTFPVASVQEFLDNGWGCDKALDFTIPANTRTTGFTFKNDEGNVISLSFINTSDETKDVMDCYVETLSFSFYAYTKGATVILPGGIQVGSTYDEVIAAWGAADKESDSGSYLDLVYGERYNTYRLDFNYDEKTVDAIYVSFNTPL